MSQQILLDQEKSVFEKLTEECEARNTTLKDVCAEAQVNYYHIKSKWADKDPETISILKRLEAAIKKHAKKK